MLRKIYVLIAAVLLVAILVTSAASLKMLLDSGQRFTEQLLLAAAQTVSQKIQAGMSPNQAAEDVVHAFDDPGGQPEIRVTIVREDGEVLFDSEASQSTMVSHSLRPEIMEAIRTQSVGKAMRSSSTLSTAMFYVAVYVPGHQMVARTSMTLNTARSGLFTMFFTALGVLLLAILLLGLLASFMVRRIIRPLQDLNHSAQEMAAGHYDVRVSMLSSDENEITTLSAAFNTMAERLQQTVNDLEERNARLDVILDTMAEPLLAVAPDATVTFMNERARETFGRDLNPGDRPLPLLLITHSTGSERLVQRALNERKSVRADLVLRPAGRALSYQVIASPILTAGGEGVILTFHDMTELQRLQKMRTDFVANVTHELRTPLTSIRGFIETLRNGAIAKPEVADRFLQIIDIEAERLHQLISDILVLSEIEEIKEDTDKTPFDLNELIDDVTVLFDDQATEHRVSIIAATDEPLPVRANRDRIKQILINLIDNAIKYSTQNGKVFVQALRQSDGRVRLTVRDDGLGIEPEHQARLFERFYRVDKGRSRELGGTGLGLSIVKHIAQLYGGQASVESIPGVGSTFTVILGI